MSTGEAELPTREELLSGALPPGKRASALLFAIESQTAHLVAQSQRATALYLTKKALEERERAFLEALAAGREPYPPPTIQQLERYARHWRPLVAEAGASLRAALANALAQKHAFRQQDVPGIRAALGLDDGAVQQAYQRLYREPLSSIYAPQVAPGDRARWALSASAARLEGLPPFWVAFALTLPVGPGLLALPIAVADVGPLPAVVLLIIFGLINALTAAALAETVARCGITRFGLGYLGQLVSEYLGGAASLLLTSIVAVNNFLVLIVFYIGVADTLEGATRLPAELWIAGLFAMGLYFVSRRSLSSTVASSLVIALINVTLLIILPLFAVPYVELANLAHAKLPFVGGRPFDPSVLQLVFGVMLSNYFSHMLIANYGRVVIRRDASARSWILGSIASIGLTTLISSLWVLTFNGAISAETLASSTGTALTALAAQVGPAVNWLGAIFVILSLGMAGIHISLGLLFLIEERLPAPSEDRLGARSRFLLSISPIAAVFLVTEWLSITDSGSFAGLLGIVGVISLPLLAGIFPVLLVAASRRKGGFVPGLVLRALGNRAVLVSTYLLFLGSIFMHGLFIWDSPVKRAATMVVGCMVLGVTGLTLRGRALDARVVVELREDLSLGGKSMFNITASGQPARAKVWLTYESGDQQLEGASGEVENLQGMRQAVFHLPATGARELKVWVHRITPEGSSTSLPAWVEVHCGNDRKEYDLKSSGGQVVLPLAAGECRLEVRLRETSST
jgi:amino acid permease